MHIAVVDLSYGDAGKGATVDWLTRDTGAHTVVRHNGGAQAAHNVITPEGIHHTFAQFGSGTFAGARTHLSKHMLVDLFALTAEAAALAEKGIPQPLTLVEVEEGALLTTPYHQAANRERERRRGQHRLGSCGMGIGETVAYSLTHDAPRIEDTRDPLELRRKLEQLQRALEEELGELDVPGADEVAEVYEEITGSLQVVSAARLGEHLSHGTVIFEGAQGILLDEWWGFHPHNTWSTTTSENAEKLARTHGHRLHRVGVTRTYSTRHGAGPFVSEDPNLTEKLAEPHNTTGEWQGTFRRGHLDLVALKYAIEVNGGIDSLSLTCLDQAEETPELQVCTKYHTPRGTWERIPVGRREDLQEREALTETLRESTPHLEAAPKGWKDLLEEHAPVHVEAWGPRADQRERRRALVAA